jgi:hypothetical protein
LKQIDDNETKIDTQLGWIFARMDTMKNERRCFSIEALSFYIFQLVKINAINNEKAFLRSFLTSLPYMRAKQFIIYNYKIFIQHEDLKKLLKLKDFTTEFHEKNEEERETLINDYINYWCFLITVYKTYTKFGKGSENNKLVSVSVGYYLEDMFKEAVAKVYEKVKEHVQEKATGLAEDNFSEFVLGKKTSEEDKDDEGFKLLDTDPSLRKLKQYKELTVFEYVENVAKLVKSIFIKGPLITILNFFLGYIFDKVFNIVEKYISFEEQDSLANKFKDLIFNSKKIDENKKFYSLDYFKYYESVELKHEDGKGLNQSIENFQIEELYLDSFNKFNSGSDPLKGVDIFDINSKVIEENDLMDPEMLEKVMELSSKNVLHGNDKFLKMIMNINKIKKEKLELNNTMKSLVPRGTLWEMFELKDTSEFEQIKNKRKKKGRKQNHYEKKIRKGLVVV